MNKPASFVTFALFMYVLFLFYGALHPFHDWGLPQAPVLSIVLFGWFEHIFLFDIVQNLLLFLPFGFFASGYLLLRNTPKAKVLLLATLASFCLSFFIESVQTYNPARIPSLLDVALNTASGLLGGLLAIPLMPHYPKLIQLINSSVQFGNRDNLWPILGIAVWICWAAYQLFPFIPTLHPKQLLEGVMPIYLFFKREIPFYPMRFCHYALQAMMLYFSGKLFLIRSRFMPLLIGFIALIFLGKVAAVERLLSIEMLLGTATSILVLAIGHRLVGFGTLNNEITDLDEPETLRREAT